MKQDRTQPAQPLDLRQRIAAMARAREKASQGWESLDRELVRALRPTFGSGKRLDGSGMRALTEGFSERLRSMGSVYLAEEVRPATRTRPKGESREVRVLLPVVEVSPTGSFVADLVSITLNVDARRASMQMETVGLRYTSHVYERAVERVICPEDETQSEILKGLLDNAGLLALWRRGVTSGAIPTNLTPCLPFRDGLFLGHFLDGETGYRSRVTVDVQGSRQCPFDGNILLSTRVEDKKLHACYQVRTAIGSELMSANQVELWVAMRKFSIKHHEVLMCMGEASLWNDTMAPSPLSRIEPEAAMYAARDLVRLIKTPGLRATMKTKEQEHVPVMFAAAKGM